MTSVTPMLSLVLLLLCGVALAANEDAAIKSSGKDAVRQVAMSETTIKGISARTGSKNNEIHYDGHTDEPASKPIKGTKLQADADDDSEEDTTRLLEKMNTRGVVLPTTDHQWGRRCGQTIQYVRPVSCELYLRSFTFTLVRLDRVRIRALVAYGAVGMQLELLYGSIVVSAGVAIGTQPTRFRVADSNTGKKALWVFPINSLPAPRWGSCCWKRVNITLRIYSCLFGNCGVEALRYYFTLRCRPVCSGRGRSLAMNSNRRCPLCRR